MRRGLQYLARHRARMVPTAACSSRSGPPGSGEGPTPPPPPPPSSPMPPLPPTNVNIRDEENMIRISNARSTLEAMDRYDYYLWLCGGRKAEDFTDTPEMSFDEIDAWATEREEAEAARLGQVWNVDQKTMYWLGETLLWDERTTHLEEFLDQGH